MVFYVKDQTLKGGCSWEWKCGELELISPTVKYLLQGNDENAFNSQDEAVSQLNPPVLI